MAFSHFPQEQLDKLKAAFDSTGLLYDPAARSIFLRGIDIKFVGMLAIFPMPAFQLLGDLDRLNSVERLTDGTTPFEIWLRNAAGIFSGRTEAKVFMQTLDNLSARMSGIAPIADAPTIPEIPEAIVGKDDMVTYGFLMAGHRAGESVAKLEVTRHDNGNPTPLPDGSPCIYNGTGWLLTKDLLITNHHVANARNQGEADALTADLELQAVNTTARFDFDSEAMEGVKIKIAKLEAYNADLDYAVLRLSIPASRSALNISKSRLEIKSDSYIALNIIQHPSGGSKKVALRNNLAYDSAYPKIRYFTDTQQGSSGSPVFDDQWKAVALHRASTFVENVKFQGRTIGWVNEGVQIAAILEDLKKSHTAIWNEIEQ